MNVVYGNAFSIEVVTSTEESVAISLCIVHVCISSVNADENNYSFKRVVSEFHASDIKGDIGRVIRSLRCLTRKSISIATYFTTSIIRWQITQCFEKIRLHTKECGLLFGQWRALMET